MGPMIRGFGFYFNVPYNITIMPNNNPLYWQSLSTINTGKYGNAQAGMYTQWAGYTTPLPFWNSTEANIIHGTDGTRFSPGLDAENVTTFIDQIGRQLVMTFNGTENVQGIPTRRYIIDPINYANASVVPANAGYNQVLSPTGVLNVSSFLTATGEGAIPGFISQPYFMGGDASLSEPFNMPAKPDWSRDIAFVDVEPVTGQVIRAAKRLQVNVLMIGNESYAGLNNIYNGWGNNGSTMFMPAFIVEESTEVTPALASTLKMELGLVDTIPWVGIPVFFSLFGIFFLLTLLCYCRGARQPDERRALLDEGYHTHTSYTVSGKPVQNVGYHVSQ
jgi:lysosome membrane protein 2